MQQQPYKVCPQCGQPAVLEMPVCGRCGHQYRTEFVPPLYQTQAVMAVPRERTMVVGLSAARIPLIATMWGLTAGCIAVASFSGLLSVLLDIPALILAIILVCGRNRTEKINGWIKIGLEILAFFLMFVLSFLAAATSTNPPPTGSMSEGMLTVLTCGLHGSGF